MTVTSSTQATIESLSQTDADAGWQLSTEAGWNQTLADWRYLLAAGQGFGVRAEGQLVATSLALPYPPAFGWVSMVLVTARHRRQGLATLLMQAAVRHLLDRGLTPRLDATPEGREVYSRMGFIETEQLDRWRGTGSAAADLEAGSEVRMDDYAPLDLAAFGASRTHLLRDLVARPGSAAFATDAGYSIRRRGRVSSQIGPIVARTSAAGRELLRQALDASAGPLIADVPRSAEAVAGELTSRGFSIQRPFHRMVLGTARMFGDTTLTHCIGGPELG